MRDIAKRWSKFIFWSIGLFVAAFGIGRALTVWLGADVASFDAGLLATVAGIVVGVPIAVRLALDQQETARREAAASDSERREALLDLIARDLREAQHELEARKPGRLARAVAPPLGSGLLSTLQASGDLRLIRDPDVLTAISRAYDRIGVTAYLERQAWETFTNPEARRATSPPQTIIQDTLAYVAGQDEHTQAAINAALSRMGRLLA